MSIASQIQDSWRNLGAGNRVDKPVLQVVIDGNGDPKFVTEEMLASAIPRTRASTLPALIWIDGGL